MKTGEDLERKGLRLLGPRVSVSGGRKCLFVNCELKSVALFGGCLKEEGNVCCLVPFLRDLWDGIVPLME